MQAIQFGAKGFTQYIRGTVLQEADVMYKVHTAQGLDRQQIDTIMRGGSVRGVQAQQITNQTRARFDRELMQTQTSSPKVLDVRDFDFVYTDTH